MAYFAGMFPSLVNERDVIFMASSFYVFFLLFLGKIIQHGMGGRQHIFLCVSFLQLGAASIRITSTIGMDIFFIIKKHLLLNRFDYKFVKVFF
jgi:hypothetical protein